MSKSLRKDRQQGQTMVEFGLLLPVLAMLLFGVIQFGIAFNNYLALTDAVRAGARQAAVAGHLPAAQRESKVEAKVREAATDLNQAKLVVDVDPEDPDWTAGSDVTVTATYPYKISLFGIGLKTGNLESKTTERVE